MSAMRYKEPVFAKGIWRVTVRDIWENILEVHEQENVITDLGRASILKQWVGVAGSSFIYLGVGDGSTAAASTDTQLDNELTGNASRITTTDDTGGAFDAGDVISDLTVPPYTMKVVIRGVFGLSDGNNGQNFREFALFDNATHTPPTGLMGNRFVLASNIAKTGSISVTCDITLRA